MNKVFFGVLIAIALTASAPKALNYKVAVCGPKVQFQFAQDTDLITASEVSEKIRGVAGYGTASYRSGFNTVIFNPTAKKAAADVNEMRAAATAVIEQCFRAAGITLTALADGEKCE